MAHEISHVVLRHGTAQASKATKYQAGQIAGAILGAIVGGGVGSAIAQGTQFGLGTAFLRFGRDYEKQADIEGAQIMARAGYDPRDMANMFKTIEKTAGSSGPEWLSDHPNPGNRSEYIAQEARSLRVENVSNDSAKFDRVKSHLKSLPQAPTERRSRPRPFEERLRVLGRVASTDRQRRASVVPPDTVHGREDLQGQRAVQLAAVGGLVRGDLRAGRGFRHRQGPGRVHTRDRIRRVTNRRTRSRRGDARAGRLAGARQSADEPNRRLPPAPRSAGATDSGRRCRTSPKSPETKSACRC